MGSSYDYRSKFAISTHKTVPEKRKWRFGDSFYFPFFCHLFFHFSIVGEKFAKEKKCHSTLRGFFPVHANCWHCARQWNAMHGKTLNSIKQTPLDWHPVSSSSLRAPLHKNIPKSSSSKFRVKAKQIFSLKAVEKNILARSSTASPPGVTLSDKIFNFKEKV